MARWIGELRAAADHFAGIGGGLVAGGVAYAALFAVVPGVLLAIGVVGLAVEDPGARERVAEVLAGFLPPLGGLIESLLAEAAAGAVSLSLIGIVGLLWGASRFAVAFETAISLAIGDTGRRGTIERNILAFVAVVTIVAGVLLAAIGQGAADAIDGALEPAARLPVVGLVLRAVPPLALGLAVALAYRVVPVSDAPWRAILAPAMVVAALLAILARLFVALAPLLVGSAAAVGSLATAFVGLAWFGASFQGILFGAAWVGVRARRGATGPGSA